MEKTYQRELNFLQTSLSPWLDTILTKREMDIVNYLLIGATAKEIAKILSISYKTVERHLANIRQKLECRNKIELVNKIVNFNS